MNKVLIINQLISKYRIDIYELLSKHHNLTIAHCGEKVSSIGFKQILLKKKNIGPFSFMKTNLHKLCNQFEVVISEGNIRYLDRNILILNPFRKYKWIAWGIGVSASYEKSFDKEKRFDFIRHFIFKRCQAQLFYSDYPIKKYIKNGFKKKSLFVAHNTTPVNFNSNLNFVRKNFLFVGTLYKQKKIHELIDAYRFYFNEVKNPIELIIIGDGPEKKNVEKTINSIKMNIKFLGAIFDSKILERYFREAIACISPGQAGLSVLKSMGHGTPFITRNDSITGGEKFNIKHNKNGIIYGKKENLKDILLDIHYNKSKYLEMGYNAKIFYDNERRPDQMISGFLKSIKYVLSKENN